MTTQTALEVRKVNDAYVNGTLGANWAVVSVPSRDSRFSFDYFGPRRLSEAEAAADLAAILKDQECVRCSEPTGDELNAYCQVCAGEFFYGVS